MSTGAVKATGSRRVETVDAILMGCGMGWCRCAMQYNAWLVVLGLRSVGGSAREALDGRGSLERVRVACGGAGWTSRFNVPAPFQDKRPRPVKKEKGLGQRGTLSPSQRGRGQIYRTWRACREGSQESGMEIKLAGQGQVMLLRAFWQQTRSSAGSGLAGGGGLWVRVWRSVELNRVGVRPRFIHGRGRHSIPGASIPLAGFGPRPEGDSLAWYLGPVLPAARLPSGPSAGWAPPDTPASLGSRYWGTYWWSLASFRSSQPAAAQIEAPGPPQVGNTRGPALPCALSLS